ncbi:hypothetical protein AB1Y20_013180 [Prymnesium parvum]|uniref:BRCT domain-containing protein n=1 Tax=Prymnesium parvum TaxID=97485 RepID=A0AB34IJV3_PRYPA
MEDPHCLPCLHRFCEHCLNGTQCALCGQPYAAKDPRSYRLSGFISRAREFMCALRAAAPAPSDESARDDELERMRVLERRIRCHQVLIFQQLNGPLAGRLCLPASSDVEAGGVRSPVRSSEGSLRKRRWDEACLASSCEEGVAVREEPAIPTSEERALSAEASSQPACPAPPRPPLPVSPRPTPPVPPAPSASGISHELSNPPNEPPEKAASAEAGIHRPPRPSRCAEVTLLMTGIGSDELQLLKSIARRLQAGVVAKWTPSVSHVVTASRCGGNASHAAGVRLCSRTIKYCSAVLHGQWLVDSSWVLDSDSAGMWVDETPYEIAGDHKLSGPHGQGLGAPCAGRLRRERNEASLFTGWRVCLHGVFTAPKKSDLCDLLTTGGATISDVESVIAKSGVSERCGRTTQAGVVVLSEEPPAVNVRNACGQIGVQLVASSWLLDSISHYELRPLHEYSWR